MGFMYLILIAYQVHFFQISVGFFALGMSLIVVSTFIRAETAAIKSGFEDDINTYLLISGSFTH